MNDEIFKNLSVDEFAQKCLRYNKEHEGAIDGMKYCPVDTYADITSPLCHGVISGIKTCVVCGKPMCPVCGRHSVTQLSRVTGYVSSVEGWNEAKKQELKDRKRHNL